MITRLAESVAEIVRACSTQVRFEGGVASLPKRLGASARVAPEIFCIYFDLLDAVRRDSVDDCLQLLHEFDARLDDPLPSFYSRWGGLRDSTARRYLTYVNADPTTSVEFEALCPPDFDAVRSCADAAFAVLERAAPEIGAEIRSLLTEIVFVSGSMDSRMRFDGATSFFCWGALFLNADEHRTLVDMVDGLSHESAHAYLFALSEGETFVNNAVDELYHSPLRSDPRPLDGIFHATYVSARTHYAHRKLLESGVLSAAEEDAVEQALIASQAAFRDGLRTLEEHASLTGLGRIVMSGAREYMRAKADYGR